MTPDQITQLRTLLLEILNNDLPRIHTAYAGGPDRVDIKIANARWDCSQKIRQALALLPCKTCNGTGKVKKTLGQINNMPLRDYVGSKIPCPDCQPKPCPTCNGTKNPLKWGKRGFISSEPCPDCQKKPTQEESPPSTMWEHLH